LEVPKIINFYFNIGFCLGTARESLQQQHNKPQSQQLQNTTRRLMPGQKIGGLLGLAKFLPETSGKPKVGE
jgi:hypothetical protein